MLDDILSMEGICKSFGGVHALKEVNFSCKKGEIHCLAGENGAGKSTILKILAGVFSPDSGTVYLNGKPIKFHSPAHAQKMGISMVYQELTLIPEMTVAENIYLNMEPKNKFGMVDKTKINELVRDVMSQYDIEIDPQSIVKCLSVAEQQMTEILKILVRNPQIIILDEPTSALSRQEVEKMYRIMREMVNKGKTIIFISHRMEEVFTIADRVTVFKDGSLVDVKSTKQLTPDALVKMMVGRELQSIFPTAQGVDESTVVLEVQGICVAKLVSNVDFTIKKGEILGIAGLQGHGQTELLNAIAGVIPKDKGAVFINGKKVNTKHSWDAIKSGIALVPSDRKTEGLMLSLSVRKNLSMASLNKRKKLIFVDKKQETCFVDDMVSRLSIKLANAEIAVQSLSGGNQQKVVLGKELAISPKVILFNEPTRGIDVEAKREFYSIMRDLANSGVAVVICSSDLMEIVGMSDRIIVMYEGKVSAELGRTEITEENIMRCAVGMKSENGGVNQVE